MYNRSELPVFPAPKRVVKENGRYLTLSPFTRYELIIHIPESEQEHPEVAGALADLRQKLSDCFCMGGETKADAELTVEVTLNEPEPKADCVPAQDVSDQEYHIVVQSSPAHIAISAYGRQGLRYAVTSMGQLLRSDNNAVRIPEIEFMDWPSIKERGLSLEGALSTMYMTKADWFEFIDYLAELKFNTLIVTVYNGWYVQFDGEVRQTLLVPFKNYPQLATPTYIKYYSPEQHKWIGKRVLPYMFAEDLLGEVAAYARRKSIRIIPGVNSLSHNTLIPSAIPEVSALNEDGEPELLGFCTRNPKTYELLFKIYDEIIDRYLLPNGLDTIGLGLDEVWEGIGGNAEDIFRVRSSWCRCKICRQYLNGDNFLDFVLKVVGYLKQRGIKAEMAVDVLLGGYDDDPRYKVDGQGLLDRFATRLEEAGMKEWLSLIWWYYTELVSSSPFTDTRPELGLRGVAMPWTGYYHYTVHLSSLRNIAWMSAMARRDKLEGVLAYSSNDPAYDRNYSALADCTWNEREAEEADKCSDDYVTVHFGQDNDLAKRGFRLLDLLTESLPGSPENAQDVVAKRDFVYKLPYFFYCFPVKGEPYPRLFPGSALKWLLSNRVNKERALYESASMAREAEQIFTCLSEDVRVDQKAARQYALEAGRFRCYCEDYLALLHAIDLSESGQPGFAEKIATLADRRYAARLSMMELTERIKPAFTMEVDQRHNSIFLQFFADLGDYIRKELARGVPEQEIHLDFTDMRYLASPQFNWLR